MFFVPQPLHFAGIGGIGMSGLAEIARAWGCTITGSDVAASPTTERLQSLGIKVTIGHNAENLGQAKALVVTSAVDPANPEVEEARRRKLPIVRRGELLAEFMRPRRGVAVGGSHGKTTTTAMIATIALEAAEDPTVVVGGRLPALDGANSRAGNGPWLIAESDESDGSFLELAPEIAVVTNVDREHLDHYKDLGGIREAFTRFANKPPFYGCTVICVDDVHAAGLLPSIRRRLVTYGHSPSAELRITQSETSSAGSRFQLVRRTSNLGTFTLPVLGEHNVSNAAAAAAVALEMGISPDVIRQGLAQYRGVARRLEIKGREQGITIIDDYGHHPSEIKATLAAARLAGPARLVVLFQPHRFTRTRELMEEFTHCFGDADLLRVADIYAASEGAIEGVTSLELVRRIKAAGHPDALWTGPVRDTVVQSLPELKPGDLVITLGAGSITQAAGMILRGLRGEPV